MRVMAARCDASADPSRVAHGGIAHSQPRSHAHLPFFTFRRHALLKSRALLAPRRRLLLRTFSSSSPLPVVLQVHQVHNPIHRFFHILDGTEPEAQLSDLFADADATLHISKANAVLAGDEIDAWCDRMRAGWHGAATLHTESNIVLEQVEPALVVSHSAWTALIDGKVTAYGTHADILEATTSTLPSSQGDPSEWRFRRRVVRHLYSAS